MPGRQQARSHRLGFRPGVTAPGSPLDVGPPPAAHIPPGGSSGRVVVVLHGAGGRASGALDLLRPVADQAGLILVAPQAVAGTWDLLVGGFGPDVQGIDRILEGVAAGHRVDRVTLAGFSDGASYALSLGLANGDVFDSVVAFSPGFVAAPEEVGRPRVFVSHGVEDRVLPVDRCSRRLVPALQRGGHDVTYVEFAGGHVVPPGVARQAVDWLVAAPPPGGRDV